MRSHLQSYTVVYSTYPDVSPLFWWIPRFSFMCCNKVGHFSMPVKLAKRPGFRIYMSQILFSSEIVDGLLGPDLRREKYLGFRTGSLLQHASPMSTLRKDSIWQQILEKTRNSRISTTPLMEPTQAQMTFISVQLWPGVLNWGSSNCHSSKVESYSLSGKGMTLGGIHLIFLLHCSVAYLG